MICGVSEIDMRQCAIRVSTEYSAMEIGSWFGAKEICEKTIVAILFFPQVFIFYFIVNVEGNSCSGKNTCQNLITRCTV